MSLSYRIRIASCAIVVLTGVAVAMPWHALLRPSPKAMPGWATYDRFCLPCHGVDGDGRGPAAPYTRGVPHDFTRGDFAWRTSTIATRADLHATIEHGIRGTSMPGFVTLTPAQVDDVIDVILAFAPPSGTGKPIAIPPRPAVIGDGAALWTARGCASCHGADGRGNAALANGPYDLTTSPLRRPSSDVGRASVPATIAATIVVGAGAMPGYNVPPAELWALADHAAALNASSRDPGPAMDRATIDRDRAAKITIGTWPAHDPTGDGAVFEKLVEPQGPPPAGMPPVEASLYPHQCARCHAKQYREYETSLHRAAMSPGFRAQTMGMTPERVANCRRCHAPLPEQATEPALAQFGVPCAGCHVRKWERHGPDPVSPTLSRDPAYPLTTLAIYERADFCIACHQLAPRHEVAGRPLLDTYREWLEGPYMPAGVQCQSCHMPDREHTWKGIHDQHAFRQGVAFATTVNQRAITATLKNIGAGHRLPTTPTPAVYLVARALDARGTQIGDARLRIGRKIESIDTGWRELEDTRLAPGGEATLAYAAPPNATRVRITVEVYPDDYYTGLYTTMLASALPADRRALYEQALARSKAAAYTAIDRTLDL